MLQLLEENERQLYTYDELNNDDVLRLVVERNMARQNFEDLQQLHADMIEQLRVKASELAEKIAERRNQNENENQPEDNSQ